MTEAMSMNPEQKSGEVCRALLGVFLPGRKS